MQTKMHSINSLVPKLIDKIYKKKKEKWISHLIAEYEQSETKEQAAVVLTLITLSYQIQLSTVSMQGKSYKPTKIECQSLFLKLVQVRNFVFICVYCLIFFLILFIIHSGTKVLQHFKNFISSKCYKLKTFALECTSKVRWH